MRAIVMRHTITGKLELWDATGADQDGRVVNALESSTQQFLGFAEITILDEQGIEKPGQGA